MPKIGIQDRSPNMTAQPKPTVKPDLKPIAKPNKSHRASQIA